LGTEFETTSAGDQRILHDQHQLGCLRSLGRVKATQVLMFQHSADPNTLNGLGDAKVYIYIEQEKTGGLEEMA